MSYGGPYTGNNSYALYDEPRPWTGKQLAVVDRDFTEEEKRAAAENGTWTVLRDGVLPYLREYSETVLMTWPLEAAREPSIFGEIFPIVVKDVASASRRIVTYEEAYTAAVTTAPNTMGKYVSYTSSIRLYERSNMQVGARYSMDYLKEYGPTPFMVDVNKKLALMKKMIQTRVFHEINLELSNAFSIPEVVLHNDRQNYIQEYIDPLNPLIQNMRFMGCINNGTFAARMSDVLSMFKTYQDQTASGRATHLVASAHFVDALRHITEIRGKDNVLSIYVQLLFSQRQLPKGSIEDRMPAEFMESFGLQVIKMPEFAQSVYDEVPLVAGGIHQPRPVVVTGQLPVILTAEDTKTIMDHTNGTSVLREFSITPLKMRYIDFKNEQLRDVDLFEALEATGAFSVFTDEGRHPRRPNWREVPLSPWNVWETMCNNFDNYRVPDIEKANLMDVHTNGNYDRYQGLHVMFAFTVTMYRLARKESNIDDHVVSAVETYLRSMIEKLSKKVTTVGVAQTSAVKLALLRRQPQDVRNDDDDVGFDGDGEDDGGGDGGGQNLIFAGTAGKLMSHITMLIESGDENQLNELLLASLHGIYVQNGDDEYAEIPNNLNGIFPTLNGFKKLYYSHGIPPPYGASVVFDSAYLAGSLFLCNSTVEETYGVCETDRLFLDIKEHFDRHCDVQLKNRYITYVNNPRKGMIFNDATVIGCIQGGKISFYDSYSEWLNNRYLWQSESFSDDAFNGYTDSQGQPKNASALLTIIGEINPVQATVHSVTGGPHDATMERSKYTQHNKLHSYPYYQGMKTACTSVYQPAYRPGEKTYKEFRDEHVNGMRPPFTIRQAYARDIAFTVEHYPFQVYQQNIINRTVLNCGFGIRGDNPANIKPSYYVTQTNIA